MENESEQNICSIAKDVLESTSHKKFNHLHLYLSGLKNPIDEAKTKEILFCNHANKQDEAIHARLV